MSTASHHHITPFRTYLAVGLSLGVLTVITVVVSFVDLGGWNAVVAVGIASIKAALVALVFMHLLYDKKILLVIFLTGLLFLSIMIIFLMFDILRRDDIWEESAEPIKKQAIIYEEMLTDSTLFDSLEGDSGGNDSITIDSARTP